MHLPIQLILQLGEPAQLWTPSGHVAATNERFNELLGLAPGLNWAAEKRRFVDDPQLGGTGCRELALKALGGSTVDIAALPYTPPGFSSGDKPPESLRLFMRLRPLWNEDNTLAYVLCTITEYAT
ncbi:MAG: hypothetical protein M3R04_04245, partial [bacterium]|nr:hypothetical protein [bacterium]